MYFKEIALLFESLFTAFSSKIDAAESCMNIHLSSYKKQRKTSCEEKSEWWREPRQKTLVVNAIRVDAVGVCTACFLNMIGQNMTSVL